MNGKAFRREAIICAAVILTAYICRIISRNVDSYFISNMLNFLRVCLYIGLFSAWGFSVKRRIMQTQVRKYLMTVSLLVVFWLTVKELRYRFVVDAFLLRQMWYSYYIPIMLIPLIAVFVSLSIGRSGDYRLPKRSLLLYVPTAALILMVLTNDLHFLAFRFDYDLSLWQESSPYSYGAVFLLVVLWVVILVLSAVTVMFLKSRVPNRKKLIRLPLIPFAVMSVYLIIYAFRRDILSFLYIDDLAVTECLVFVSFFETCVQCGLIQSNSHYFDLFKASENIPVRIFDSELNPVYTSRGAETIDADTARLISDGRHITENGKRFYKMRIKGGYAVWSEDISELILLKQNLEETREEPTERNGLLQLEYEREKQHKSVEEQNRLYDLLQTKTHRQLEIIDGIVSKYKSSKSNGEKKRLLSEIVVLGSYIKRRKDFVLSVAENPELPCNKLSSAFAESYHALSGMGIAGAYLVDIDSDNAPGEVLAAAYDFFEDVMEATLGTAHSISVRVCRPGEKIRTAVLVDCECEADSLFNSYPSIKVEKYDDGTQLVLDMEGGLL